MAGEAFIGAKLLQQQQQQQYGFSAGLAIVLSGGDANDTICKSAILSSTEENEKWELERTLGHIFEVSCDPFLLMDNGFDVSISDSILQVKLKQLYSRPSSDFSQWDGVHIIENGFGKGVLGMDERSASGDIRFFKHSLLVESQAMFSSARANACVSKGKWMYEVTLETVGIQQLGWATVTCPFTRHEGVGDDKDSYAYGGRQMKKWNKDS